MNTPTLTSSEESRAPWNQKDQKVEVLVKAMYTVSTDDVFHNADIYIEVCSESEIEDETSKKLKEIYPDFETLDDVQYDYSVFYF